MLRQNKKTGDYVDENLPLNTDSKGLAPKFYDMFWNVCILPALCDLSQSTEIFIYRYSKRASCMEALKFIKEDILKAYNSLRNKNKFLYTKFKDTEFIHDRHKVAAIFLYAVMKAGPFILVRPKDKKCLLKLETYLINEKLAFTIFVSVLQFFFDIEHKIDTKITKKENPLENMPEIGSTIKYPNGEESNLCYEEETLKMIFNDFHDKNPISSFGLHSYSQIAFFLDNILIKKNLEAKIPPLLEG